MRLGIYGGSFDPVHNGHLALARSCQEQAALDEVWFMPTAIQPLKRQGPQASAVHRIEMLRLAIESEASHRAWLQASGNDTWRVCTLEIDRGGYSYTVDTMRQLQTELPEARLFFMIGADATRDIPQWKEPAEIFHLATPLIVRRLGEAEPDFEALRAICSADTQPMLVEMTPVDVSSSEIRRRVAAGESLDGMVPLPVADFIRSQHLYR